jgi:hypothetical protein
MNNIEKLAERELFMRINKGVVTYSPMDLDALKKACEDAITPIGNMEDSPVLNGLLKGSKFHNACNPHEILAIINELEQAKASTTMQDDVRKDAWISVEESEPTKGDYLGFVYFNGRAHDPQIRVLHNFINSKNIRGNDMVVTHWQPLPSPPLDKARE